MANIRISARDLREGDLMVSTIDGFSALKITSLHASERSVVLVLESTAGKTLDPAATVTVRLPRPTGASGLADRPSRLATYEPSEAAKNIMRPHRPRW